MWAGLGSEVAVVISDKSMVVSNFSTHRVLLGSTYLQGVDAIRCCRMHHQAGLPDAAPLQLEPALKSL